MRIFLGRVIILLLILGDNPQSCAQMPGQSYSLKMEYSSETRWPYFQLDDATNCVIDLESTTDWMQWAPLAKTLHRLVHYPDYRSLGFSRQFYRARITPLNAIINWKNQVSFPNDYFLSEEGAGPSRLRWIKFMILLDEPYRVYYQNCRRYLFHYDFALANVPAFKGVSPTEFEAVTLRTNRQMAVMGALLYPPAGTEQEYGIQLLGYDPYAPSQIAQWFGLIRSTVVANSNVIAYYLPENQQALFSQETQESYLRMGIPLTTMSRWYYENLLYSSGWAAGMLKYFALEDLPKAIEEGRLKPEDILLTTQAPLSLPSVAGIIVLTPATPNSHVAILSRSFGIPFVYFSDTSIQRQILSLTNRLVVMRAYDAPVSITDVFEISAVGITSPINALRSLKSIPTIHIQPKSRLGKWSANVEDLDPSHMQYFGGKASAYGFLRRAIPDHARPAIAFSFDLWDAFMAQPYGNNTLRDAIAAKTSRYSFPPVVSQMKSDLAEIQSWITDKAGWEPSLKQVITNALAGRFLSNTKIRFRSSSNSEDSEYFTGAGLYDSYSGCLADDLDTDDTGPSHADPSEKNERGVFRAIKKVYASLYNERAFGARLQFKIPESSIGMGLLVHESFPDKMELANGVATASVANSGFNFHLVTQKGSSPVANPDNSVSAEEIAGQQIGPFLSLSFKSQSSLVPFGQKVLTWDQEYHKLCELFTTVAQSYRSYFTNKHTFDLDFEYKKISPGNLLIKQVREMPSLNRREQSPIFLVSKPAVLAVFQDEYSDLFSNHRLKSMWTIETRSGFLTSTNSGMNIFQSIRSRQIVNDSVVERDIVPEDWRFTIYNDSMPTWIGYWKSRPADNHWEYSLSVSIANSVPDNQSLRVLEDCRIGLHSFHNRPVSDIRVTFKATYPDALPGISSSGGIRFTNEEKVALAPPEALTSDCPLQIRTYATNQVRIQTRYYWPRPPLATKAVGGYVDGYTPMLIKFDETRIDGLTEEPLILRSELSQTYRPGHHVFYEEFLFEPRLDPNVNARQKEELLRWPVQFIYLRHNTTNSIIRLMNSKGDLIPGF